MEETKKNIIKNLPVEKISKWYNVDEVVYKIAFDLAKERFEDVLSESESITNKSIKLITAIIAFSGFFTAILINGNLNKIRESISILSWCAAPILLVIAFLVYLLFPKKIKNRGIAPISSIVDGFDNDEDKSHQEKLIYYTALSIYQTNIDFMIKKNSDRHKFYTAALISSIVILAYIPCIVVYVILYHS